MIIFDLDGTLADCEHRRHFVDPTYKNCSKCGRWTSLYPLEHTPCPSCNEYSDKFKPNWTAFYEACDKDPVIEPVLSAFIHLTQGEPFNQDVQIWSGRCESVRKKTLKWLVNLTGYCEDYEYWDRRLRMRPIGDNTPDDQLKEMWLDEVLAKGENIEYVFDDRPKVIRMWRRRGIFVFNCCQHESDF